MIRPKDVKTEDTPDAMIAEAEVRIDRELRAKWGYDERSRTIAVPGHKRIARMLVTKYRLAGWRVCVGEAYGPHGSWSWALVVKRPRGGEG